MPVGNPLLARVQKLKGQRQRQRIVFVSVAVVMLILVVAQTVVSGGSTPDSLTIGLPIVLFLAFMDMFREERIKDLEATLRAIEE